MLAFSNDYYGIIFRATQSVELFCAYDARNVYQEIAAIFERKSPQKPKKEVEAGALT